MKQKVSNLKESAYKSIKAKIIHGHLKPGDAISEDELQAELNVSRTPIRESLIRLQSENFVVIYPRKGIFVVNLTPKIIREIFEVREFVEPQVLRKVFRKIDKSWLLDMKEKLSLDMSHLPNEEQKEYFVNLDDHFHNHLLELSENDYLIDMMEKVYDQVHRTRIHTFFAEHRSVSTKEEHVRIIDAILDEDIELAVNRLLEHVIMSKEVAVRNLLV